MKKILIALLCAFTLFTFASCNGSTPGPAEPELNFSQVDEPWWGTWEIETGTHFVITEDDIVMYANSNDKVGQSLFISIYTGDQSDIAYVVREKGYSKYVFKLPVEQGEDTTMEVLIYNEDVEEPTRSTYYLVQK